MEISCGFCKEGPQETLGQLHYVTLKNKGNKIIAAHHKCMQYSAGLSQFKCEKFGGFKVDEVDKEIKRGRLLRCNSCRGTGATAGCAVHSCRRSYHFPCAPRTKRIEQTCGQKTRVLYRVFCSQEHHDSRMKVLSEVFEISDSSSESEDDAATGSERSPKQRKILPVSPKRPRGRPVGSTNKRRHEDQCHVVRSSDSESDQDEQSDADSEWSETIAAKDSESDQDEQSDVDSEWSESIEKASKERESQPVSTKRGRGRPVGSTNKRGRGGLCNVRSPGRMPKQREIQPVSPRRPRGRPVGSTNKRGRGGRSHSPRSSDSENDEDEQSDVESECSESIAAKARAPKRRKVQPVLTRRPRGRPVGSTNKRGRGGRSHSPRSQEVPQLSTSFLEEESKSKLPQSLTPKSPAGNQTVISPAEQARDDATIAGNQPKPKSAWAARLRENQADGEKQTTENFENLGKENDQTVATKHTDVLAKGDSESMRMFEQRGRIRLSSDSVELSDSSRTVKSNETKGDKNDNSVSALPLSEEEAPVVVTNVIHGKRSTDVALVSKKTPTVDSGIHKNLVCHEGNIPSPLLRRQCSVSLKRDLDGTEVDQRHLGLSPTPEASGSESSTENREDGKKDQATKLDDSSVVLLIPSLLKVPQKELAALHRDLGITSAQSIMWPSLDKLQCLEDSHLPHFMLDIVTAIKTLDWAKVLSVLTEVNTEKYDYLLEYLSKQSNETSKYVAKEYLHKVAEALNGVSKETACLKSRKYENMSVLVIYLTPNLQAHQDIITCLSNPVFEWNGETALDNTSTKCTKFEEELDLFWGWFMGRIQAGFRIESYPRQTVSPVEKCLFNHSYLSETVRELINNLTDLKQRLSFDKNTSVDIIAVNGVNKQLVKYKDFVKGMIDSISEDMDCDDLYFIIAVNECDEIQGVGEILPDHLTGAARVYTAFDPKNVSASCLVVHISKTELTHRDSFGQVEDQDMVLDFETPSTETSFSNASSYIFPIMHQGPSDPSCSVTRSENEETMYFNPVDVQWQLEKSSLLGLTVKRDLPSVTSRNASRLEAPKKSVSIREDGNCYFRAICHVLTGNQGEHKAIRSLINRFMVENNDEFSKLADCTDYAESKCMNDDGVWATEIEIFATATMLATDVCVYSPCGADHKWLTYKPLPNVSPLEEVRHLRNSNKWVSYRQTENAHALDSVKKHRKAIYLSNIDDHYVPVYSLSGMLQ